MGKLLASIAASLMGLVAGAVSPSGSLPVIYINTENAQDVTSKDTYLNATYYLDPKGDMTVEAIGSAESPLPLQIKGRGNYTWTGFDKKPYRLKLSAKAALMGMKSNKHFALMAHADDPTGFMRNIVGLELSRLIGMEWTPADEPVELVLNGDYKGLYFLTELIRVDKDRVNIKEQNDGETDPEAITGGWLVEIDNYDSDPHVEITEGDGSRMIITYDKTVDAASEAQTSYLTSQFEAMNQAIYSDDVTSTAWADMIDADALARFYIVQEIVDDFESFHGSCYLYRDRGEGQKWKFGPVWDFGSAMFMDKTQYIYEGRQWHQHWIGQMCRFPWFMARVKELWDSFYTGDYGLIYQYVTDRASRIDQAAKSDARRWADKGYGCDDVKSKATWVNSWLESSSNWLNRRWGTQPGTEVTLNFYFDATGTDWNPVRPYIFDRRADGSIWQVLGSWGERPAMTEAPDLGENCWGYTCVIDKQLDDPMIIFGNDSYGSGNQTDDLTFVNNAIYNVNGFVSMTGVERVAAGVADGLSLRVAGGTLYVSSPRAMKLPVYSSDGRVTMVDLVEGENAVTGLGRGFYIAAGRKITL
jgi:hypothetical protein